MVLEPLSGGTLRLRELQLRLFVFGRTPAGVGLERALRRPAGDRAVPEPRRGQVRPARGDSIQHPGDCGDLRRGREPLAGPDRRRPDRANAVSDYGDRHPVGPVRPRLRGTRQFRRRLVPYFPVAEGADRFLRQAGRRHRHGRDRGAAHYGNRRERRPSDRLSAYPELLRAAPQRPDRSRNAAGHQSQLPADLPEMPRDVRRLRARLRRALGAGGLARGTECTLRRVMGAARLREMVG